MNLGDEFKAAALADNVYFRLLGELPRPSVVLPDLYAAALPLPTVKPTYTSPVALVLGNFVAAAGTVTFTNLSPSADQTAFALAVVRGIGADLLFGVVQLQGGPYTVLRNGGQLTASWKLTIELGDIPAGGA